MAGDFMRPVVDIVDQLLTAGVNVTVYNGQLDLIVDTMGNSPSVLVFSAGARQQKPAGVMMFSKELRLKSASLLQVRSCG